MTTYDFSGRNAIVTGGGSGLGLGIATHLAKFGATVESWDISTAADPTQGVSFREVDVRSFDSVKAAAEQHSKIDILVNCAGVAGDNATTWDYDPSEWERVIDINLNGVFRSCHNVVPIMLKNGSGKIVNIASVAGKEGNPLAAAYGASKGGVLTFTKALGKELADKNILVNAITPAAIDTPLLEQSTPEFVDYMISKIPMGRLGRIEEVAAMVMFMCSDECSFTTGGVFDLSGGRATY